MKAERSKFVVGAAVLASAFIGYLGGVTSQEQVCDILLGEVQVQADEQKAQIEGLKQGVKALESSELEMQGICNRALRSFIDSIFSEQDTFTKEEWEMERPYVVREEKELDE